MLSNDILTVKDRLDQNLQTLTPSEQQVANIVLTDYPVTAMQSLSDLADSANVSTPTIVRLARKLGYDGFSHMQKALREEVAAQIKQPVTKHDAWASSEVGSHILNQFAQAVTSNLRQTSNRLDRTTFEAVASILGNNKRPVYLAGGRITRSNADYFYNHLQISRPNVTLLGNSANVWPQYILDMNKKSVLVLFDIRRYEKDLLKLAKLASERECTIVLFTDQWGSPISKFSQHTFKAFVEAPSGWDSTISIMFIVEALIAAIQDKNWECSKERIDELESMFNKTKLFRNF